MSDTARFIISALLSFMAGTTCGMIVTIGYGIYRLRQKDKEQLEKLNAIKSQQEKDQQKMLSIKKRLIEAQGLTEKQFELLTEMDLPSKNAMHSKYKNGLNTQLKELETAKIAILRGILGDGFDPDIDVMSSAGGKETIKLSDYIGRLDKQSNPLPQPEPPKVDGATVVPFNPPTVRKVGKFFVHSGGKIPTDGSQK